jgi:hypothetical protein
MDVRVLGDGEEMPKATDLFVELATFVGALLGGTDDPDVLHHVVHVDRLLRRGHHGRGRMPECHVGRR